MKSFIIGITVIFLSMTFSIFQQDYILHQQHMYNLKFTASQAAAAASQYIENNDFREGNLVFNQQESIKAAEYIIKSHLKLNNDFTPKHNSYWTDQITYDIEFFDDSNSTFPFLYTHSNNKFSLAISEPIIVITIYAGEPRYRLFTIRSSSIQIAMHEWKGR